MRTEEAIARIDSIHSTLARAKMFRGYRSHSTMFSAVMAIIAALVQSQWIPNPTKQIDAYLFLWGSVAILSLLIAGRDIVRSLAIHSSPGATSRTVAALSQLLPGLIAGGAVTIVLVDHAPTAIWMLPGLWSVFFGLSICSAATSLPKVTHLGGAYFVLSGVALLSYGPHEPILTPASMVVTFGFGQALNALILFWTIERNEAATEGGK